MKSITLIIICLFITGLASAQKNYKEISFKKEKNNGKYMDLKKMESYFSYIPSQSYQMPDQRIVTSSSFYMMRFEVPNMLYKMFMDELAANGKTMEFNTAFPDTNIWADGMDPYRSYYYQHPAYNEYPVLGISRDGANLFCEWLEEKITALSLKEWKNKKIHVRLPSEAEWMMAASGDLDRTEYAWAGPYMRYPSGPKRGDYMANFCPTDDSEITRDANGQFLVEHSPNFAGSLFDNAFVTAPVVSYWPNGYGLYNMCGNVREMVLEEGFTKGGGWIDPGGELKITARNTFHKEGFPCEGFRVVLVVD